MKRGIILLALMLLLVTAAYSGLAVPQAWAAKKQAVKKPAATATPPAAASAAAQTAPAADAPPPQTPEEAAYQKHIELDPFYPQMMAAATILHGRRMVDFIASAIQDDDTRLEVISYWLRSHTFLERDVSQVNSLYFMSYADTLYARAQTYKAKGDTVSYTAFMREAIQTLYAYEALASADAVRCEDKTVIDAVRNNTLLSRFQSVLPGYLLFPSKDFDAFGKIAILVEQRFAARPPNLDICSMGAGMLVDIAKQPGTTKKYVDDPNAGGEMRTMLVPPAGYAYQPKLVSDAAWTARRTDMDKFLDSDWLRRYAVLKDAAEKEKAAEAAAQKQAPKKSP